MVKGTAEIAVVYHSTFSAIFKQLKPFHFIFHPQDKVMAIITVLSQCEGPVRYYFFHTFWSFIAEFTTNLRKHNIYYTACFTISLTQAALFIPLITLLDKFNELDCGAVYKKY